MKRVIISILVLFLFLDLFGQERMSDKKWIDSVFYTNFERMQNAFDSNMMYDTHVDRIFVYMTCYFSGIECKNIDFSGFCYFDEKKLKQWKDWFELYKDRIEKEKVVWCINALKREKYTQQLYDSLDNLIIP